LAEEKLKERLIDLLTAEIRNSKGFERFKIGDLGKYEKILSPEYDEQLLDLYENMIWKISEFAGGRSYYREIVGFVRKMIRLPKGKDTARKMLESWRICYSNRPAMQEELGVLHSML
jgi:hypothetical protein